MSKKFAACHEDGRVILFDKEQDAIAYGMTHIDVIGFLELKPLDNNPNVTNRSEGYLYKLSEED